MANNRVIPDITVFLPILCEKYKFKQNVIVQKDLSKAAAEAKSKSNRALSKINSQVGDRGSLIAQSECYIDLEAFTVKCAFDLHDKLKEFYVENKSIPLLLMKIFTLLFRFYPELNKITLKRCELDQFALAELGVMIEKYNNITELCLDDSNCPANNFDLLLEMGQLKSLSLSRCDIGNDTCRDLFNNLRFPETASKNLQLLDLTSNGLTDVCAEYIAKALEGNRTLRYLNLSGNGLTDKGATQILNCFTKFPVSEEALSNRRVLYFHYLVKKKMLYENAEKLRMNGADNESIKSKSSKNKNELTLEFDIDTAADEKFVHPFDKNNVSNDGGNYYCHGNFALAYLNLAYNNIGYFSLKKLKDVLEYQRDIPKSSNSGLIKVVIEGNPLPKSCSELTTVCHLLEKSLERSCMNYGLRRGSLQLRRKK